MDGTFRILGQASWWDILNGTSLQELQAGLSPLDLPDGPKTGRSSRHPAHANRSQTPDRKKASPTSDTSGQLSTNSSKSSSLQSALASRLAQNLDVNGSPEYALTWKTWDMQSGPPICALRASAHRTSGSAFTGWPTCAARDWRSESATDEFNEKRWSESRGKPLSPIVALADWRTPKAGDGEKAYIDQNSALRRMDSGHSFDLRDQVLLAGWATPCASQANSTPENFLRRKRESVERTGRSMGICLSDLNMQVQAWTSGQTSTSSPAPTEKRGGLNAAFSAWLMGFPPEWCQAAIRAFRKLKPQRKLA